MGSTVTEHTIREVSHQDIPDILDILISVGWFDDLVSERESRIQTLSESLSLSLEGDKSSMQVVVVDEVVAGYVAYHMIPYCFLKGAEVYISELFIKSDFRGMGLGTRLIDAVVDFGKRISANRIMLISGRHRTSYQRNFYKNYGFIEREKVANLIYNIRNS